MKNVVAEFYIDHPRAFISAPDGEEWGAFGAPNDPESARFVFEDTVGPVELRTDSFGSFVVRVTGVLPEEVIDAPEPTNVAHQGAVVSFFERAFTALDVFLHRFRLRFADIQARPLRWRARTWTREGVVVRRDFSLRPPAILKRVVWYVDDETVDGPNQINLKPPSSGWGGTSISYDEGALVDLRDEITALLKGEEAEPTALDTARETAYELVLHAQELLENERDERGRVRPSVLSAAIISTAAACEVYVRRLVKAKGRRIHRTIMEDKDTSFSVADLLQIVIEDMPEIGESLNRANPELASNIRLLFDARNRSTHKGTPSIVLTYRERVVDDKEEVEREVERSVVLDVTSAMVHDPSNEVDDDELGTFTLDVLSLIGWLETKFGGRFANKDIEAYWSEQRGHAKGTRRTRLLKDTRDD